MKFFTNKSIWNKIIAILIFIILFQFVIANPSFGFDGIELGGKLLSPFLSLIVGLGDGIMGLLHSAIMGQDEALFKVELEEGFWSTIWSWTKTALKTALTVSCPVLWIITIPMLLEDKNIKSLCNTMASFIAGDSSSDTDKKIEDRKVKIGAYSSENINEISSIYLPLYTYSPEEIFKGNILLFNVNFFNNGKQIKAVIKDNNGNEIIKNAEAVDEEKDEVEYYYYTNDDGEEVKTSKQDLAKELKGTISKWYVTIRNIVLVCMMIVLLYIGIRMILSSLASDKAKYRQMLQDWFMGLILVIFMHYIMAFSVAIVEKITDIVSMSIDKNCYAAIVPDDKNHYLSEGINSDDGPEILKQEMKEENGDQYLIHTTNLMGYIRMRANLANYGTEYIGMGLCFVVLVFYTLFFTVTYVKRLIYMAFLTLIAPVVSLTYPIDKMNDGSAQGFNKWFREYLFNLLIQPLHLLLYYVLVSSAFELVSSNFIFALVAIGFLIPAEKLLRSLFGFEKASTPGMLAGATGAALTMGAISKLGNLGKGSKSSGKERLGSGSIGEDGEDGKHNLRMSKNNLDSEEEMIKATIGDNDNKESKSPGKEGLGMEAMMAARVAQDQQRLKEKQQKELEGAKERERQQGQQKPPKAQIPKKVSKIRMLSNNARTRMGRKAKSVKNGVKAQAKAKIKNIPKRAKKAVYSAPRGLIRFATTSTTAMAGIAAGIATGDAGKAMQYGLTAGATGYALGGGIANKVIPQKSQEYKNAYDATYYGDEYDEINDQKYIKEFIKENKQTLENNFGKEKAKRMIKNGTVDEFLENGVDNVEDMVTAQRMIEDGDAKGVKEAATIAKYANRVGSDYNTTKSKEWKETFADEYKDKKQLSQEDANIVATETMKRIEKFNKAKKKNFK